MTIYHLTGFTDGPHWDYALIEAPDAETAKGLLAAYIVANSEDEETIWEHDLTQPEVWKCSASASPLVFVLGAGCRGI